MAISDFLHFGFWPQKISKNHFFRKMITKSKIFKIFKNRNICCRACGLQPVWKFSTRYDNFWPQKGCFCLPIVPNDDVIHLNAIFKSYSPLTGKLMVPLDFWGDSASETYLFSKNKFWKFDLFWPFWPDLESILDFFVQIKSNCKITDYRVFCPKWTIKHVSNDTFENFGFGDLFWPDLDLDLG